MEVNNDTTTIHLQCTTNETTSYVWEKQNGAIPANAEGANSNKLTLNGVTPDDSGQYRCVANNEYGRSFSNYATVTVTGTMHWYASIHISHTSMTFLHTLLLTIISIAHPPVVTVTPSSVAASEGDSVTLTCLATGVGASNFTYEWLLNSSVIRGVSSNNITINTVSENTAGNYMCIVKNQYGDSSQSNAATIILSKHLISF